MLKITQGKLISESHGKKFQLWEYCGIEYVLYVPDGIYITREEDIKKSAELGLNPIF
jgi:hypothetical protein